MDFYTFILNKMKKNYLFWLMSPFFCPLNVPIRAFTTVAFSSSVYYKVQVPLKCEEKEM